MLHLSARLRGRALGGACALGLATSAAHSQSAPCDDPAIAQGRARAANTPMLYDGAAPLAHAPTIAIPLPPLIPSGACVLLSVVIVERGGRFFADDVGYVSVAGPGMIMQMRTGNRGAQMIQQAAQVVRDALQQSLFTTRPRSGGRYLVAVPITSTHPLYAAPSLAQQRGSTDDPSTLRDRGFATSTLLSTDDGIALYRLGGRGNASYFAYVRNIADNEPIVEYIIDTAARPFTTSRYGPREDALFRARVLPHLRDQGQAIVRVTIYHYARNTHLERRDGSRFPWNSVSDEITGQLAEPPVAAELWEGQRRNSTEEFTWQSASARGSIATDLNTIAAIQALHTTLATQAVEQARVRREIDARVAAEQEARVARRRARDAERGRVIRAAGLQFLADSTWARYRLEEMRSVFDGEWPNAPQDWRFGTLYKRTIRAFSSRCRHLIPPGSPFLAERITRTDSFGNEHTFDGSDTTFIQAAFAEPYRWEKTRDPRRLVEVPPAMRTLNPGQMLAGTGELAHVMIAMRDDMAVLFERGCTSPVVQQFMENLRRLALRLPTLQAQLAPASLPIRAP